MEQLITGERLINIATSRNWQVFDINIWGIRTAKGEWNDFFLIFPKNSTTGFQERFFVGTTEPSAGYVDDLMNTPGHNPVGIFVLKSNEQYIDCWLQHKHKGRYDALGQSKAGVFKGYRKVSDGDEYYTGKIYTDANGINLHSTKPGYIKANSGLIKTFSEGCQVIMDYENYINDLIPLIYSFQQPYSYTLIDSNLLF